MIAHQIVPPDEWHAQAQGAVEAGFTFLDLLAGIDRVEERELVLRVVNPENDEARTLITRVPASDPRVPSLADLWAGAAWQEREISEMFDVVFDGHPDPRPLLTRDESTEPPLLKSTALPERLSAPWPGAAEARERKRRRPQLPPGVRQEWVDEASGGSA